MLQRSALLVGGLGAAALLALALGLGNFVLAGPNPPAADPQSGNTDVGMTLGRNQLDATGAGPDAGPQTQTVYDNVYVAPAPPPKVIHVTKTGPTTARHVATSGPGQQTAAPAWHGDDGHDGHESEHDGGDD